MRLQELTEDQIKAVYEQRMREDFPSNELKPLDMIMNRREKGIYECLGLFNEGELAGYVYLVRLKEDYLIDYLAIDKKRRNAGYGGELIRLLSGYLVHVKSIIGEVEDPEYAQSEADRELRTRRQQFYFRNGFRDTGVKATCFGEPFMIIEMGEGLVHTEDEIISLYRSHYKAILPEHLYEKQIRI